MRLDKRERPSWVKEVEVSSSSPFMMNEDRRKVLATFA